MAKQRDDRPDHLKFGYDQMIEMRRIEENLRNEGFEGVKLHFEAQRCYDERHKNDVPYRVRQQIAKERGEAWAGGGPVLPSDADLMRAALEAIRDGHNDARSLAAEVLEQLEKAH